MSTAEEIYEKHINDSKDKFDRETDEFLIHWIESILNEKLQSRDLWTILKSGVILCRIINAIEPGAIPNFCNGTDIHPIRERENINFYLEACWKLGMDSRDIFMTSDLYNGRYMKMVRTNIVALSYIAAKFDTVTVDPIKIVNRNSKIYSDKDSLNDSTGTEVNKEMSTEQLKIMELTQKLEKANSEISRLKKSNFTFQRFSISQIELPENLRTIAKLKHELETEKNKNVALQEEMDTLKQAKPLSSSPEKTTTKIFALKTKKKKSSRKFANSTEILVRRSPGDFSDDVGTSEGTDLSEEKSEEMVYSVSARDLGGWRNESKSMPLSPISNDRKISTIFETPHLDFLEDKSQENKKADRDDALSASEKQPDNDILENSEMDLEDAIALVQNTRITEKSTTIEREWSFDLTEVLNSDPLWDLPNAEIKTFVDDGIPMATTGPKFDCDTLMNLLEKDQRLKTQLKNRLMEEKWKDNQILDSIKDEQITELLKENNKKSSEIKRLVGLLDSNKMISLLKDSQMEEFREQIKHKEKELVRTRDLLEESRKVLEAQKAEFAAIVQKKDTEIAHLTKINKKSIILSEQQIYRMSSQLNLNQPQKSPQKPTSISKSHPIQKGAGIGLDYVGDISELKDDDFIFLMSFRQKIKHFFLGDPEPTDADVRNFAKLLSMPIGGRFFYPLLRQAIVDQKAARKEVSRGSYDLLVCLIEITLDSLDMKTGGDYICAKIILEISTILCVKTPLGRDFIKDQICGHLAWTNLSFWEEYFWDCNTHKIPWKENGAYEHSKAHRESVIKIIRLFLIKMMDWVAFPESSISQFIKSILPGLGLANEEDIVMEKVMAMLEKKKDKKSKSRKSNPASPKLKRSNSAGDVGSLGTLIKQQTVSPAPRKHRTVRNRTVHESSRSSQQSTPEREKGEGRKEQHVSFSRFSREASPPKGKRESVGGSSKKLKLKVAEKTLLSPKSGKSFPLPIPFNEDKSRSGSERSLKKKK